MFLQICLKNKMAPLIEHKTNILDNSCLLYTRPFENSKAVIIFHACLVYLQRVRNVSSQLEVIVADMI